MSTEIFPAGVNAMGATTWIVTPTNPLKADGLAVDLAVLTGATAVDLTCYLAADDQEITVSQDRDDDTRACDDNKREEFGAATFGRDSIVHIVDPQKPGTVPGNLAVDALPADSTVYITQRLGVKHRTSPEISAADLCIVYEVTTGAEHETGLAAGKYKREVMTSFNRIAYRVPAAAGA